MAITRLKRKELRKKIASKRRKTLLRHLTAKPIMDKNQKPATVG